MQQKYRIQTVKTNSCIFYKQKLKPWVFFQCFNDFFLQTKTITITNHHPATIQHPTTNTKEQKNLQNQLHQNEYQSKVESFKWNFLENFDFLLPGELSQDVIESGGWRRMIKVGQVCTIPYFPPHRELSVMIHWRKIFSILIVRNALWCYLCT